MIDVELEPVDDILETALRIFRERVDVLPAYEKSNNRPLPVPFNTANEAIRLGVAEDVLVQAIGLLCARQFLEEGSKQNDYRFTTHGAEAREKSDSQIRDELRSHDTLGVIRSSQRPA